MSYKKDTRKSDSGLDDRENFQKSEGYKESTSSYPDDRLQKDKQVLNPAELGVDKSTVEGSIVPNHDTTIAKAASEIRSKVSVRPDSAVKIEDGKQVGGVPLGASIATRTFAGAGAQSPADDMSRNPSTQGGYRPITRLGKRISEQNFEINNTISEQTYPVYDESKDLRESPDSSQGYNGRKQFKQARGKKNSGLVPQSLLFDRSADVLYHDEIVYTDGQVLDSINATADYPTKTFVGVGVTGADDLGYADIVNPMHKGNYSLDSMKIHIDSTGLIDSIGFNESRFVPSTSYKERDVANMNWQVDANNVTQAMVNMQTKLGRETTDKWSPLGYVVKQPYQFNMLFHDEELTLASISAACYRASVCSLAMQLNMLGKDGAKPISPAVDSAISAIGDVDISTVTNALPLSTVFNRSIMSYGCGSALVPMFDSVLKYSTKADLLTMQRSMKLPLSTADNNMNPFRCKKNFILALNTAHTFSTEDGNYNPNLPVYVTKKIKLINPLSLQYFLEGWVNPRSSGFDANLNDPVSGCKTFIQYSYNDLRNRYTMPVRNPFVEGICKWIVQHQSDIVKSLGTNTTVSLDCTLDFTNPTLFELIVCAAMQDIAFMRNTYFRDILFAGEQETYVWDDLTSLKELNPLWSDQLQIVAYDSPLKLGKLRPAAALRCFWPETFTVGSEQTGDGGFYIMPWYMNEQAFATAPDENGSWLSDSNASTMTMPSIRSGVRHAYVDVLYANSERDVRLSLDRLVTIPTDHVTHLDYGDTTTGYTPIGGTYIDDIALNSDSSVHIKAIRYDSNSDGRIGVEYDNDVLYAALLCTPRELGWLAPGLPIDHCHITRITSATSGNTTTYTLTFDNQRKAIGTVGSFIGYYVTPYSAIIDGSTSWMLKSYAALGVGSGITSDSISITAALQQDYTVFYAGRSTDEVSQNTAFVSERGFAPTLSAILQGGSSTAINVNTANVTPVYELGALTPNTNYTYATLVPVLWGILDRVFFAVNPFENCLTAGEAGEAKAGSYIDPMENAYLFGVSGSLASDFNQDNLERLDKFDQLNLNYLEDEFVHDSLIFRV